MKLGEVREMFKRPPRFARPPTDPWMYVEITHMTPQGQLDAILEAARGQGWPEGTEADFVDGHYVLTSPDIIDPFRIPFGADDGGRGGPSCAVSCVLVPTYQDGSPPEPARRLTPGGAG